MNYAIVAVFMNGKEKLKKHQLIPSFVFSRPNKSKIWVVTAPCPTNNTLYRNSTHLFPSTTSCFPWYYWLNLVCRTCPRILVCKEQCPWVHTTLRCFVLILHLGIVFWYISEEGLYVLTDMPANFFTCSLGWNLGFLNFKFVTSARKGTIMN